MTYYQVHEARVYDYGDISDSGRLIVSPTRIFSTVAKAKAAVEKAFKEDHGPALYSEMIWTGLKGEQKGGGFTAEIIPVDLE